MKETNHNRSLLIFFEPRQDYWSVWTEQISRRADVIVVPQFSFELTTFQKKLYDLLPTTKLETKLTDAVKKSRFKKALRAALRDSNRSLQKCFFFSWHYDYIQLGFVDLVKKAYKNAKIAYEFGDKVAMYDKWYPGFDLDVFRKQFDLLTTYNPVDANKHNLFLTLPKGMDYSGILPADCEDFDVFFVGKAKDRLEEILSIAKRCIHAGLSIRFFIVNVPDEEQTPIDGVIYNQFLPYKTTLSYSKRARAILNIFQSGADGITLRDKEAIGMNKILITDGKAIFSSPFYTEEKVIPLGELENQIDKIRTKNDSRSWNEVEKICDPSFYFDQIETELNK